MQFELRSLAENFAEIDAFLVFGVSSLEAIGGAFLQRSGQRRPQRRPSAGILQRLFDCFGRQKTGLLNRMFNRGQRRIPVFRVVIVIETDDGDILRRIHEKTKIGDILLNQIPL